MISSLRQKQRILRTLLTTHERCGLAISSLPSDADDLPQLKNRFKQLTRTIESLWGDMARQWNGTAENKVQNLKSANARIKRAITGLNDRVRRAERTAKILGLLDEVIALADRL